MHPVLRTEEDLLGLKDIPDECYYGIHTLRAIENFRISRLPISSNPAFIKGMVQVKKAAAIANAKLNVLNVNIADAIIQACEKILVENKYIDQFPVDVYQGGAGTSVNMNVNEVLANIALEMAGYNKGSYHIIHPNDHVNKSQSTNDAYPTGFRITMYQETRNLLQVMERLRNACAHKAREFNHVPKMGRTQLRDDAWSGVFRFQHSTEGRG